MQYSTVQSADSPLIPCSVHLLACIAGIVQRRLSNGMKINYCQTDNEPQAAMVRMVAAGGRALEGQGPGPSGTGVVSIGTRTLSESGTVGNWRRDQVGSGQVSGAESCPWAQ